MSDPEPIKFEQITIEQKMVLHVSHWPQYVQLSLKLLTEPSCCRVTDAGKIMFTVDNGWARYKLATVQLGEYYICLELEEKG